MMENSFSNPFLRGACAQSRCSVCNRMLANGKCLEGCESKPPPDIGNPRTEPEIITVAAPRLATLDAPVFSEAFRRDAAESVARRIEAERAGETPAREETSRELSNCSDASGQREGTQEGCLDTIDLGEH